MKDKLKRIYNSKSLWITILCLVQIVPVLANWYYYTKTNYCCDIYITSPTDCEVSFVTPTGKTYTKNVSENETFREYKRPLADVRAPECAKVEFSSDEIQVLDVLKVTMKNIFWVWIVLTYMSILRIFMKV